VTGPARQSGRAGGQDERCDSADSSADQPNHAASARAERHDKNAGGPATSRGGECGREQQLHASSWPLGRARGSGADGGVCATRHQCHITASAGMRDHGVRREETQVTFDELLRYCLGKPGAWQDEPWEGDVVAKVGSKIFAFLGAGTSVGVKCGATREVADEWLARFPDHATVMPYIGRSGWNSLQIGGGIPDEDLLEAIDASYDAVVAKLPRKDRPAAT
jgi:predicted DNA-binding protein (MmcQ/YjbR family)